MQVKNAQLRKHVSYLVGVALETGRSGGRLVNSFPLVLAPLGALVVYLLPAFAVLELLLFPLPVPVLDPLLDSSNGNFSFANKACRRFLV